MNPTTVTDAVDTTVTARSTSHRLMGMLPTQVMGVMALQTVRTWNSTAFLGMTMKTTDALRVAADQRGQMRWEMQPGHLTQRAPVQAARTPFHQAVPVAHGVVRATSNPRVAVAVVAVVVVEAVVVPAVVAVAAVVVVWWSWWPCCWLSAHRRACCRG